MLAIVLRSRFMLRASLFGDTEFFQPSNDVGAVVAGFHFLVDVQNLSIFADVVGPAIGVAARTKAAKLGRKCLVGITQDWVVKLKAFGKVCVFFNAIATCCEVGHVKFS